MFVRATLLAVTAAALLPLTAPAHASCLDDLTATDLEEGYSPTPRSPYWNTVSYAQVSGTATVSVQGDALASDVSGFATDQVRRAGVIGDNALRATTTFVDCVAG